MASGDTTTIGEYEYYGDNRRSKKVVSNHGPEFVANDGGNQTTCFYYDRAWRIVETRNGSNQTTFQYLWGTQYTDELIWIEKNGDPSESNDTNPDDQTGESTADERYFVHQDRNWNVVALTEYDTSGTNNGRIAERYSYTPYGSFVVLTGESASDELCSVTGTSTVGNAFLFQGLSWDSESATSQQRFRQRAAARFLQRDPLAFVSPVDLSRLYADGMSLYLAMEASPLAKRDPLGLYCKCCTRCVADTWPHPASCGPSNWGDKMYTTGTCQAKTTRWCPCVWATLVTRTCVIEYQCTRSLFPPYVYGWRREDSWCVG